MQNEQENIELLQSMMGDLNADVARRVLIKHKGDIQAAASAILEGDRGDESAVSWPMDYNADSGSGSGGGPNVPRRPNTPRASESSKTSKEKGVIDLTKETGNYDQDLSRALQMSLENAAESTSQNDPVLRPSDRVPDPSWAMVPSNVPSSNVQEQEDQSLSRAIEASLSTSFTEDKYEDLPQEERIRKPGHPVALRTKTTELYFATLVLQALFYVPQVRERLARWRPKQSEGGLTPALGSPEYLPYALQGLFTFLDLVLFSYINIDGLGLESHFKGRRATSASDLPGELSNSFYSHVANSIESQLWCEDSSNRQWERLFHLRHAPTGTPLSGDVSSQSNALGIETTPPLALTRGLDISCVRVDIFGSDGTNDLLSCLSSQLGLEDPPDIPNSPIGVFAPQPQSLVSPSDVIAFELARPLHVQSQTTQNQVQTVAQAPADVNPFRYPMYVYLDQFLRENASLAAEMRTMRKKMQSQLQELIAKRESLTRFEGKDTLNSLSSALHYYENIATKEGLPSRAEEVKSTAISLRKILTKVENEVQNLEGQISRLRSQTEKIFDDPLLQKHRYELRAVLVHDGLFGRNHIHSFVQHAGRWWKTQDASVIEVSEEVVLTDNTGLHLNAGPYYVDLQPCDGGSRVEIALAHGFQEQCKDRQQRFFGCPFSGDSGKHTLDLRGIALIYNQAPSI
ncbi:hypothetical protein DFH11DRAFT_1879322 [Phellopilus nigrolimitatus]|nr:hypothetical protein DFH11DRAFT_1879322 [Phellopilus nigrolimitatus]